MGVRKRRNRRELKQLLFERQDGRCCYCRTKILMVPMRTGQNGERNNRNVASFEHLLPRRQGGSNRDDNLALACLPCNGERDKLDMDWLTFCSFKRGELPDAVD